MVFKPFKHFLSFVIFYMEWHNTNRRQYNTRRGVKSCKIWVIVIIVRVIVVIVTGFPPTSHKILLRRLRTKSYFVGYAKNPTL